MLQIELYKKDLVSLCKTYKVRSLFLFGSAVGAAFSPESDIDLVVEFEPLPLAGYASHYFNFKYALEELFQRKVDLLEKMAIKNPFIQESIAETQQLLYAA
jgi:uncharacterized protein